MGLARSSLYYQPRGASGENVLLMRLIDEQYTRTPFYGIRRMTAWLRGQGHQVNHKRAARLMEAMGLETIYPKPRTSQPSPDHRVYPYLLRNVAIGRPDQVWSTDITYIRLSRGFVYLVAVLDWYSRYVLSWEVSVSLDVGFCLDALDRPWRKEGRRSSTATRAASSPASPSRRGCYPETSGSAWTGEAGRWTTCSRRGCGER